MPRGIKNILKYLKIILKYIVRQKQNLCYNGSAFGLNIVDY